MGKELKELRLLLPPPFRQPYKHLLQVGVPGPSSGELSGFLFH